MAELREQVAGEFFTLRSCCSPRGVKALHESLRTPGDLFSAEKQAVVEELSWQLDLTIFDREVSHARTKSFVDLGGGKVPALEAVTMAQLGREIWQHHVAMGGPAWGRPETAAKHRPGEAPAPLQVERVRGRQQAECRGAPAPSLGALQGAHHWAPLRSTHDQRRTLTGTSGPGCT